RVRLRSVTSDCCLLETCSGPLAPGMKPSITFCEVQLNAKCQMQSALYYRFAWPRAIFFTLRFFEPRAYSRGFFGLSNLIFLRAARFAFLRSSLLSVDVFAMIALNRI